MADVLGRERYERGDGEKAGYRNGYRPGKVKDRAEGAVDSFGARRSGTRPSRPSPAYGLALSGRTRELERLASRTYARSLVDARHRGHVHRRYGQTASVAGGGDVRSPRSFGPSTGDCCKRRLSPSTPSSICSSTASPSGCGRASAAGSRPSPPGGLAKTDANRCWG